MVAHIPLISGIVPCRNERAHIESCVRSLLAQKTSLFELELLVVDGMSDDGTRDILERLIQSNPNLRMLDNPRRSTPAALNIGIQAGRGEYIAILGAHAEYGPNYLETCLKLLNEHPEVCCAGGPITSRGKGLFGQAVALAMSHPLGIGNAKHRLPEYEGYAEGACFPMFRRRVFADVGLFDEKTDHDVSSRSSRNWPHARAYQPVQRIEHQEYADTSAQMRGVRPVLHDGADGNARCATHDEGPDPPPVHRVAHFPGAVTLHQHAVDADQGRGLQWRQHVQPRSGGY